MPGKQHSKAFPSFYTLSLSAFLCDIAPSTGQINALQGQSLHKWHMIHGRVLTKFQNLIQI